MPPEDARLLARSFEFLEGLKKGSQPIIEEYLFQQVSLEQVFLRFAREQETKVRVRASGESNESIETSQSDTYLSEFSDYDESDSSGS